MKTRFLLGLLFLVIFLPCELSAQYNPGGSGFQPPQPTYPQGRPQPNYRQPTNRFQGRPQVVPNQYRPPTRYQPPTSNPYQPPVPYTPPTSYPQSQRYAQHQVQVTTCTNCNNEVSNSSKDGDVCPHCGITWGKGSGLGFPIRLIVIGVVMVFSLVGYLYRKATENSSYSSGTPNVAPPSSDPSQSTYTHPLPGFTPDPSRTDSSPPSADAPFQEDPNTTFGSDLRNDTFIKDPDNPYS